MEESGFSEVSDSEERPSLKEWVERIKHEGLPAFTHTVKKISELSNDDDADLAEISELIKQDAGMTTKVLRASNTAYRMRRGRVNTVSRALVMLGVQEVKKICLTCSLLDGLLDGDPSESLVDEMTRAFHGATQARLLAMARSDLRSEEVFLSALMQNIGPLAFYRTAGSLADSLVNIVKETGCEPAAAEKQLLGFTLSDLSAELAKAWELDKFLVDEEDTTATAQKRAKEV